MRKSTIVSFLTACDSRDWPFQDCCEGASRFFSGLDKCSACLLTYVQPESKFQLKPNESFFTPIVFLIIASPTQSFRISIDIIDIRSLASSIYTCSAISNLTGLRGEAGYWSCRIAAAAAMASNSIAH